MLSASTRLWRPVLFLLLLFLIAEAKPSHNATASAPSPAVAAAEQGKAPSPSSHKSTKNKRAAAGPAPAPAPSLASAGGKGGGSSNGTLDPSQARALAQLGVIVGPDPCNTAVQRNLLCDGGAPYKHVVYLRLEYCSEGQALPSAAWSNLTTVKTLEFSECPAKRPPALPAAAAASVVELTVDQSLGRTVEDVLAPGLPATWLHRFPNLAALTVREVVVNASGGVASVVTGLPRGLQRLTLSDTNLSGMLPPSWPPGVTDLQISGNDLRGSVPASLAQLRHLTSLDLSYSNLSGTIPPSIGNLSELQTLNLASNRLSGGIPPSFQRLAGLAYVDLSHNRLNGSVPGFLARMRALRYVDLSGNDFHGAIPFNDTFLMTLNAFKARGNARLCYNSSTTSARFVDGVPACDGSGLPPASVGQEGLSPSSAPSPQPHQQQSSSGHRGPKRIVLIVAIALACIVAVIVFAILLSKCCSSKD